MKRRLLSIVSACLAVTAASAAPGAPTPTAYTGATLIDGTGRPAVPDAVVVVSGNRIVAAGPRAQVPVPRGARRVDLAGKWLIPGLIDAHVHFFETGRLYTKITANTAAAAAIASSGRDYQDIVPYPVEAAWARARVPVTLRGYLCAGVTTAASMGGPDFEIEVRDAARARPDAPNVFLAVGPIGTVPPEQLPAPEFLGSRGHGYAATASDATRIVAWAATRGYDFVKLGRLDFPGEKDPTAMFAGAISEGHRRGMRVFVHEFDLAHTKAEIRQGVDVIAHIVAPDVVDAELIALAKARDVIFVTTATFYERLAAVEAKRPGDLLPVERRCGDPEVIESWNHVRSAEPDPTAQLATMSWKSNLGILYRSGATIAVGSDAGNVGMIHGASLHRELIRLQEAGMPPLQIVRAATLNGARALGHARDLGSIEPGKLADMVVLDRDPLIDIAATQNIAAVVRAGVWFDAGRLTPPPAR